MKRLFMIFASAVVAAGLWACPMSVMAMPDDYGDLVQDQDTGSVDTWDVDTSWFDYLDPKTQYTISTEAQLRGLASLVNEEQYLWKPNRTESFEGVTFVLTRDITLTDAWTPIGIDNQITFAGVFDGKGHSITGIELQSEDPYCGFFGHLSGTVCNLTLEGNVSSTGEYCGGLTGYVGDTGRIDNCTCNVQVAGKDDVGGIAGYVRGGWIRGSVNYGEVIGANMVGGITGECRGGAIRNCGNRGLIVSNGAGSFNNGTGGIAGRSVAASRLISCYNTGDIISSNEATGGICGYTNSTGSVVVNCYSIGTIRIEQAQVQTAVSFSPADMNGTDAAASAGQGLPVYAGGIAGYVGSESLRIENCYNAGKISGADYTGGIIGRCQNDLYSSGPAAFKNNYYVKGSYDGAIAADRENKRMRVRGAATEVYESAFGHLAASLGDAYMDDKAGAYGSQGYPVLTWQQEIQSEENLAVLDHVNKQVLRWLHDAKLLVDSEDILQGRIFMDFFNRDSIYESVPGNNPRLPLKGE